MPMPCASWIIIRPPLAISIESPACARNDAADAARPSMWTFTFAGWAASASYMATASWTNPPGLLMCRSIVLASMPCTAWTKSTASLS
jgi:hypothetical protein